MSSGRIPKQFIDDLLLRVDIVDLIDSHVPLKKSGGNFVARCPFHSEKTPSFNVSRNRQTFHCFGCGASGNAISFLMSFNHLDFVEAIEDLAAHLGVEVQRESAPKSDFTLKQDAARLYDVLEAVADFYAGQLRGAEGKIAVDYLKRRGVTGEVARNFLLGYAPNAWDALISRFDQKDLIEAGMLAVKDGGKAYDRFRGRLMFPIRDKRKRVIGFGGRVLDDSLPKYLNSPETAVFSKSKELYGICELLETKVKPAQILIVEGYMDVIALAQFGVVNAVAALGTATSRTHMDLLFRFASELVLCFDGDQAGRNAAWKAAEAALPSMRDGRQIKIMLLPQGQDPDTLIRAEGLSGFGQRIAAAQLLSDYFFEHLGGRLNLSSLEGRSQLLVSAKPQLEKLPPGFFREMMFSRLRELTAGRLLDIGENPATIDRAGLAKQNLSGKNPRSNLMRKAMSLLLQYPHLAKQIEQYSAEIKQMDFAGADLLQDILQVIALQKPENSAVLLEAYRDSPHYKTINALSNLVMDIPDGADEASGEFCGAVAQLIRQAKESRMAALIEKVKRGEILTAGELQEYKAGGKREL
ncbi:MAG: DNA primase [Methylomonas sp.]|jgi:DNA primase